MATATKAANSHTVVTTGWTSPTNAYSTTGDNVYATAAPGKNATVNGDFGFATFTEFTSSALINSVTATVEWKLSVTTSATLGVQLYNNGSAVGSETTYSSTTEAQSTQVATSGITAADILNGLVKARVRDTRGNSNTAHTGSLDFVSLTVNYTPATTYTDSGSGTVTLTGSLTDSYGHTYSDTASGSVVLSGSLIEDYVPGGTTFTDSPSGSVVLSGSLVESFIPPTVYTDSISGSLVLAGSISESFLQASEADGKYQCMTLGVY